MLAMSGWSKQTHRSCKPTHRQLVHCFSTPVETALNPRLIAGAAPAASISANDFDQIVRQHQQRIYRVLLSLVRDAETASVLTQDCFLRAYERRASFRGEASVGTWLVRIAINLARDHRKSVRVRFWRKLFSSPAPDEQSPASPEQVADLRASPEQDLLARETLAELWQAVDRLSPQQREVFLLRFAEELSLKEIAEALEVEVGTVKAHLSRALRTVRTRVRQNHEKPSKRR
jgi:RNA polymerase sigma-70 factor (ECF subfamily)